MGEGAFGDVYKCLHKPTGTEVAIKTYKSNVSDQSNCIAHNLYLERSKWNR